MDRKRRILVVDDDESILKMLYNFLRLQGYEVIKSTEITQAEFAIKNADVDLVVADIRLTGVLGKEGLELLSYVQEKSPRTKVIIMTAYGTPEIVEEAYSKGAYHYFDKPFDLQLLKDKLEELWGNGGN